MRNNFIRNLLMFGLMAMGSFNAQAQIINVNKSAGNKLNAKTTLTPKIDKSKVYLATANGDNEIYLPNVKKKMTRVMMVNSPLLVKLIMQIVFIIPLAL
jgi:hypothetical protein